MSQPKLTLRPPPHCEFIQGFPGIVGSSTRPSAHVVGTVEVRLGTKGLKAAWLRIELRKLETLPGGESWGELIGRGPIDVWSARKDEAYKSESEKGWELLQTADFPFQVTIPEGLPPSAKLEKNAGIGYELVTSLCVRTKKGLLKKEVTSSIIQNTHPLWLDKHELHSTWPVYASPEDHEVIQDEIRVKVMRNRTCYGPGDSVDVRIIVISDRVSPIKVKNISFSVRETITFKGSAKKTFGSNKAASQKAETLSSKSKNFGKKVYKGDTHTFDLACQIPRTHTLMSIQTAKHIEVSYTLRVQVDTAKKPIIIDHLPITVSNFTKTASDALMDRIGWVPGLSAPADPNMSSTYDGSMMPPSPASIGQPTITRSASFGASTYSGGRGNYPGYPGGDLRRRDTIMTQGTAISGPGMAGRGVPGQVFSWGQYGSAQPFGAGEAPRPAFAGPPSIYEGRELQPEETRALFHSTNRPQSAMVLGTVIDPVLMPASSYHGHSGGVTPIQERSEDGHTQPQPNYPQRSPYQQQAQLPPQQDMRRHSQYSGTASPVGLTQGQNLRYSAGGALPSDERYTASPADGRSPYSELPYRGPATPEIDTTRYVRPEPVHQPVPVQRQASPAPLQDPGANSNRAMTSAEAEKQRLYERARQQAERNQRRADERRALHQGVSSPSTPVSPAAIGGRPYSMLNLASSNASPSLTPAPGAAAGGLSAEAEKTRLFERARAEAERYQSSYPQGAAFPAMGSATTTSSQSSVPANQNVADGASVADGSGSAASNRTAATQSVQSNLAVSGRAAPYPSYMTAEEEKRQLYERAKAEADAYQRGEGSTAPVTSPSEPVSGHRQAASLSNGTAGLPGAWPRTAPALSFANNPTAAPTPTPLPAVSSSTSAPNGGSGSSATPAPPISEKEQLRRYYEARDAVSQHLSQSSSSQPITLSQSQQDRLYAPEVASAVHHATPHQPSDTVATPTRTTPPSLCGVQPQRVAATATDVQGYLTEAEQQSAEEKERLASHYARKQAKAEAKAAAKTNNSGIAGGAAQAQTQGNIQPSLRMVQGGSTASAPAPAPPAIPANGASEKAQLAAYYAARDATEQNLTASQQTQIPPSAASMQATVPSRSHPTPSLAVDVDGGSKTPSSHVIPELRTASPIHLPSFASPTWPSTNGNHAAYSNLNNAAATANRWRPKYDSLYDESDVDLLLEDNQKTVGVPPPLPPKIPLKGTTSFAPAHGHYGHSSGSSSQQWR